VCGPDLAADDVLSSHTEESENITLFLNFAKLPSVLPPLEKLTRIKYQSTKKYAQGGYLTMSVFRTLY
jgi:hypothetical protein